MSVNYEGKRAAIVGGGPVGCVLAELLARRGFDVDVYEKRPDMRAVEISAGRSINLVLTERGLAALEALKLREAVLRITVPVLGRMMHSVQGELTYQAYGKDDSECNYSVSRGELNMFLLDAAEEKGVRIHFEHELVDMDLEEKRLVFNTPEGTKHVRDAVIFGADGAFSAVRAYLEREHDFDGRIDWLDHGYKELLFPANSDGSYPAEKNALHIWPRGHHMLMALANADGSFTGTIYLPWKGKDSFELLDERHEIRGFFEAYYPDAIPILGELEDNYLTHPASQLGTVRCAPWQVEDRVLLIGDAAHGVVPFFGQGLNCGFEDCVVLDKLLAESAPLDEVFARFFDARKTNADAIADMALENFVEMRDLVGDAAFLLRKKVEARIEAEMPDIYRSRYATVMYSSNPYRDAFDAGEIQRGILDELVAGIADASQADLGRARELIAERLTPFYESRGVELDF